MYFVPYTFFAKVPIYGTLNKFISDFFWLRLVFKGLNQNTCANEWDYESQLRAVGLLIKKPHCLDVALVLFLYGHGLQIRVIGVIYKKKTYCLDVALVLFLYRHGLQIRAIVAKLSASTKIH